MEEEEVYDFLNIVSRGGISPDIQTEWIDDYKEDFANKLIAGLERFAKTQKDQQLLVHISNIILIYSPLNEKAISLKCSSLYNLGKKGLAKQSYTHFCNDYYSLLDLKYEKTFNEIIK